MTIKSQGGVFGRNPTFNDVNVDGELTATSADIPTLDTTNASINNITDLGDVQFSVTDSLIRANTVDGSDTKRLLLCGGGGASFSRGGYVVIGGNENASDAGRIRLVAPGGSVGIIGANLVMDSGKGIDFSATSGTGTSELFDDYEEGTFTPTVSDAASGGNNATIYSTRTGYYTKVGRLVTATITVTNIDTTPLTAGNDVFITGLPFAVGSQSNYIGACMASDITFSGMVVARAMSGQTHIKLAENTSGASLDYIVVSELTSGSADIILTVGYEV